MRLAVLERPQRFTLVDEPIPSVGPDDVLVRVAACGVCTSELDMWRGLAGRGGSVCLARLCRGFLLACGGRPARMSRVTRGRFESAGVRETWRACQSVGKE